MLKSILSHITKSAGEPEFVPVHVLISHINMRAPPPSSKLVLERIVLFLMVPDWNGRMTFSSVACWELAAVTSRLSATLHPLLRSAHAAVLVPP